MDGVVVSVPQHRTTGEPCLFHLFWDPMFRYLQGWLHTVPPHLKVYIYENQEPEDLLPNEKHRLATDHDEDSAFAFFSWQV